MTSEMGIEELRKTLGSVVNRAVNGETIHITRNGRPVAAITPLEAIMTTTTTYGSWITSGDGTLTIEDSITGALGDYSGDFDVEGLIQAYRAAIDEALPETISLCGNEFIGAYPMPDDATDQIRAAVATVDLWEIAPRFDRS